MTSEKNLDISWSTILKILFSVFVLYLIYSARDVFSLFILSFLFFLGFEPFVDLLIKLKIPRFLSIFLVYFGIIFLFSFFLYVSFYSLSKEFFEIKENFSHYFEKFVLFFQNFGISFFEEKGRFYQSLDEIFSKFLSSLIEKTVGIFGKIFNVILVVFLAFFFSLEKERVERAILLFFPSPLEKMFLDSLEKAKEKVFLWWKVKILSSLFVGFLTLFVAILSNVNYKMLISILSAILNLIPIIGPIVTGIFILILVSSQSLILALYFLFAFTVIQQIEGNIISPILAKRAIGFSPLLVLFSFFLGQKWWGILGGILTIPLLALLSETIGNFLKQKKEASS
jgi:predicted PurR-regulated permease PerM